MEKGIYKTFDEVHFRNGYKKDCRYMEVEIKGMCIGDFENKLHYAIKLGKILMRG